MTTPGERITAQLLHRPAGLDEPGAVRRLLAVQAQDARGARLALRARLGRPPLLGDAFAVTWLMRGTLHLVHRDDLPWLHALTAPPALRNGVRRLAQLGVDDPDAEVARLRAALPLTRPEAAALLGRSGQAVPHLLARLSLLGFAAQTPEGVFEAVALPAIDRDRALDELARRYAAAHPGATVEDLAAWSGLPRRDLRPLPTAPADAQPAGPRLLPPFDPLLLGWRDRSWLVPAELRERVFPGGGMFRATAVDDGRAMGTWTAPRGRVVLDPAGLGERFAAEVAGVEALLR